MASLSSLAFYGIRCCSMRDHPNPSNKKINGIPNLYTTKVEGLSHKIGSLKTRVVQLGADQNGPNNNNNNIPRKKQFDDPFRQGLIVDSVVYRQIVVVRSYEVGPNKTATIESILYLLQDTALNHIWMTGLLSDRYGATHGMKRNNLLWVVSNFHVEVDHYPLWGDKMEIETWVGKSGENEMRRDWLLRSHATGLVFARATSTWCMMDRETRCLTSMPEEVKAEISPWFTEKKAIKTVSKRTEKLDYGRKYVNSELRPERSELDVNNNVNNVHYVKWMLENLGDEFQKNHQLTSITLEYRKECKTSNIVQSLCQPHEEGIIKDGEQPEDHISLLEGNEVVGWFDEEPFGFTHLLRIKGEAESEEILRGRTSWKRNLCCPIFKLEH